MSEEESILSVEVFFCLILVTLFMHLTVYLNIWKVRYIHESGIIIIIGIIIGIILYFAWEEPAKFDASIFFNFMLPFIILSYGFNLKRRRIFRNISQIILYGVIGTILNFVLISWFSNLLSNWGAMYTDGGKTEYISFEESLYLGAVLSASDAICVLSLVQENKTPQLHSLVFGEHIVNDAIAILLVRSVKEAGFQTWTAGNFFSFVGIFCIETFLGVIFGIAFGIFCSFATRYLWELREEESKQLALMFYIAWLGYVIAEMCQVSGVITILICGIFSNHYAWYNLTSHARIVVSNSFKFFGDGATATVFAYLGLTSVTYTNQDISYSYILCMVFSLMFARFITTFGLSYFARRHTKNFSLNNRSLSLFWIGGAIRGAIAFALILTVGKDETGSEDDKNILHVTVLGIVIVTTLVIGSILPIWVKIIKPEEETSKVVDEDDVRRTLLAVKRDNFVVTQEDLAKPKSWLHRKWVEIDDKHLKPRLIHPHALEEQLKAQQKLEEKLKEENADVYQIAREIAEEGKEEEKTDLLGDLRKSDDR
ncbi:unnamed protein product [Blepharisma stoltei]|uniref:Cation/H+ exchanger transmembrane domain-containing protein n=1 Tax=Blepharisma stoltei TaxID=1481888 RepID=A0AAU9JMD6_9CILI|nr:unnamed protein product [Blepharisma stoltei]